MTFAPSARPGRPGRAGWARDRLVAPAGLKAGRVPWWVVWFVVGRGRLWQGGDAEPLEFVGGPARTFGDGVGGSVHSFSGREGGLLVSQGGSAEPPVSRGAARSPSRASCSPNVSWRSSPGTISAQLRGAATFGWSRPRSE